MPKIVPLFFCWEVGWLELVFSLLWERARSGWESLAGLALRSRLKRGDAGSRDVE